MRTPERGTSVGVRGITGDGLPSKVIVVFPKQGGTTCVGELRQVFRSQLRLRLTPGFLHKPEKTQKEKTTNNKEKRKKKKQQTIKKKQQRKNNKEKTTKKKEKTPFFIRHRNIPQY